MAKPKAAASAPAAKVEKAVAKPKAAALPRAVPLGQTNENKIISTKTAKRVASVSLLHPAIIEREEKEMAAKDKYAFACWSAEAFSILCFARRTMLTITFCPRILPAGSSAGCLTGRPGRSSGQTRAQPI